jgi:hypothetical protein
MDAKYYSADNSTAMMRKAPRNRFQSRDQIHERRCVEARATSVLSVLLRALL